MAETTRARGEARPEATFGVIIGGDKPLSTVSTP